MIETIKKEVIRSECGTEIDTEERGDDRAEKTESDEEVERVIEALTREERKRVMMDLDNEEWEQYPPAWIEKVKNEVTRIESGIAVDKGERGDNRDTSEPSSEEKMGIPWQSAFPQTDFSRPRHRGTDMGMGDRSALDAQDNEIEKQDNGRGGKGGKQ